MLHVTIYQENGEQKFCVHEGEEARDVTSHYEVHALVIQDQTGAYVNGWHIGKRMTTDEVLALDRKEGKEL